MVGVDRFRAQGVWRLGSGVDSLQGSGLRMLMLWGL